MRANEINTMRFSFWRILAKTTNLLKDVSGNHGLGASTQLLPGFMQRSRPLQVFREIANYVQMKFIAFAEKQPYDFYRSPSVLRQKQLKECQCKNPPPPDPVQNQKKPNDFYHSPSVVRQSTHKVCYWNQKPKVQYNSIDVPVPLNRPSTTGKVLYTTQIPAPVRKESDHTPNIELHTWNTFEPTQYGYWFNQPIKRQSAAQVRLISQKQMDKMHFTKIHN